MKYIYFITFALAIASCKNTTSSSNTKDKLVCSQQSDLKDARYNGRVKKIAKKSGLKTNIGSIDDLVYDIEVQLFDDAGQIIYTQMQHIAGNEINIRNIQFQHFNNMRIGVYTEKGIQTQIDSLIWVTDDSSVLNRYRITEGTLKIIYTGTAKYNDECFTAQRQTITYNADAPGLIEETRFNYDERDDSPLLKEAKNKYGRWAEYYVDESKKILAKDHFGNPTAILINNTILDSFTYEYYK